MNNISKSSPSPNACATEQPTVSGKLPRSTAYPTPDARAIRGKSRANPSDKSIIADGLKLDTNQVVCSMRGSNVRCLPAPEPPRLPVTKIASPGCAVLRNVTSQRATLPVAATTITAAEPAGTLDVSPPARTAPYRRRHSAMPRYRSSAHSTSVCGGNAKVMRNRSGFPPMAAKSETTRAIAFHPTARGGALGKKCTFSTSASVFSSCNRSNAGPRSITAQSSPGPAAGMGSTGSKPTKRWISASSPMSESVVTDSRGWERRKTGPPVGSARWLR